MYKLLLDDVVKTTTSDPIQVKNLRDLSVQVICTDRSSGNGKFEVEGSNNCTDWKLLMTVSNAVNSNTQHVTRVTSLTLSADGNDFMFIDNFIGIRYLRVVLTFTIDGKYSAVVVGNKIAT